MKSKLAEQRKEVEKKDKNCFRVWKLVEKYNWKQQYGWKQKKITQNIIKTKTSD